jgi:hypothetical protein
VHERFKAHFAPANLSEHDRSIHLMNLMSLKNL